MKKERYSGKLRSYDSEFKYYFRGNGFTLYTNDFDTFYVSENDYLAIKNRIKCIEENFDYWSNLDFNEYKKLLKETLLLPDSLLTDKILQGPLKKTILSHISETTSIKDENKNSINFYNSFLMRNGYPFLHYLDFSGEPLYFLFQKSEVDDRFESLQANYDGSINNVHVKEKEDIISFPFTEYKTNNSLSYFYINFYSNNLPITNLELFLFNQIEENFNNKDYMSILSSIKYGREFKYNLSYYIYYKCYDLIQNFSVYKNRYDKLEMYDYPKLDYKTISNNTTSFFKDASTRYVGLLFDMYCFDKVYSSNKGENKNYKYIERFDLETFYLPTNQIENLKFVFNSVQKIFRNFNKPVIAENFIKMMGLPYYALFYCEYFNFLDGSEDDFISLFNFKDISDDYLRNDSYITNTGSDAKDKNFNIVLFSRYMITNGVYITSFNRFMNYSINDDRIYILFDKDKINDNFIKIIDGDCSYINSLVDINSNKYKSHDKPSIVKILSQLIEVLSDEKNYVDIINNPDLLAKDKDYSLIEKKCIQNNVNHKIKDLFSYLNEGVHLQNCLLQLDFTIQERNIFSYHFNEVINSYGHKAIANIKKKLNKKDKNDFLINSLTFKNNDKEIKFFFSKNFYIFKIGKNYYIDEVINNYLSSIDEKEKESFCEYKNNISKIKIYKYIKNSPLFYLINHFGFSNDYVYKKYLVLLFKNHVLSSYKSDYIYDNLMKFYSEFDILTPFIKLENDQYKDLASIDIKNIFEFDYINNYLYKNNDCILYYDYKEFKKERYYIARGRIFNAFSLDMKNFYFDIDDKELIKKVFEYVTNSKDKIMSKEEFILYLGLPSYFYTYLMNIDLFKLDSNQFIKLFTFDKVLSDKFKLLVGEDTCFRLNGNQNFLLYERRTTQHVFLDKGILLKSNRYKPLTYLLNKEVLNYDDVITENLIEAINERILTIDVKNENIIHEFKNSNPELDFKFINFIQDKDNLFLSKYNQILLHNFITVTMDEDKDMYLNIISSILSKNNSQNDLIKVINKYLPEKLKLNIDNKKIETYEEIILFILDILIKYIVKFGKHNLAIYY